MTVGLALTLGEIALRISGPSPRYSPPSWVKLGFSALSSESSPKEEPVSAPQCSMFAKRLASSKFDGPQEGPLDRSFRATQPLLTHFMVVTSENDVAGGPAPSF